MNKNTYSRRILTENGIIWFTRLKSTNEVTQITSVTKTAGCFRMVLSVPDVKHPNNFVKVIDVSIPNSEVKSAVALTDKLAGF